MSSYHYERVAWSTGKKVLMVAALGTIGCAGTAFLLWKLREKRTEVKKEEEPVPSPVKDTTSSVTRTQDVPQPQQCNVNAGPGSTPDKQLPADEAAQQYKSGDYSLLSLKVDDHVRKPIEGQGDANLTVSPPILSLNLNESAESSSFEKLSLQPFSLSNTSATFEKIPASGDSTNSSSFDKLSACDADSTGAHSSSTLNTPPVLEELLNVEPGLTLLPPEVAPTHELLTSSVEHSLQHSAKPEVVNQESDIESIPEEDTLEASTPDTEDVNQTPQIEAEADEVYEDDFEESSGEEEGQTKKEIAITEKESESALVKVV